MTKTVTMLDLGHDLAKVRLAIAHLSTYALEPLQVREAELKAALQSEMQANGTKTLDVAGIQVQRRVTRGPQITDETELVLALKEAGLYESCLKTSLDRTLAKKIGTDRELPGIEIREVETVAIGTSRQREALDAGETEGE